MANYIQNYNDLHVMPDRHSTGCKGTLISYTELFPTHTGGLLYFTKDSPTLLENLDFTGATPYFSKTNYTQPFIFRNCKFDNNFTAYNIQVTVNAGNSGLKINCYNCSFLNAKSAAYSVAPVFYFENCFFQGAMGDCMKLGTGITIKNCYSAGKCGAATGAHADGIQWSEGTNDSWSIDGLRIDNLTIAPTTYANACFYFDHERGTNYHYTMTEHTLKNMWCNGGGYTIYVVASNNIQYDASKTYAVGDVCTYPDKNVDQHAYRCITAIDTAEEWNASHWESVPRTTEGIYTVENFVFEDTWITNNYKYGPHGWGNSVVDDSDIHMVSTPYVTSVWKESDGIHFLATNYTNVEKNIIVKTESKSQTFTLSAHPNKNGAGETSWDNLPIDKEFVISGEEYLVAFDTTESTENQIRFVEFEIPIHNKIDSIELPTGTYELKDANSFYAEDITTVINEDSTDEEIPSALAVYNLGSTSDYELKSNKLTSLTSTITDDNYMSAKWLYDLLGWLQEEPPSPDRPVIPKTGTWQLKDSSTVKYISIGSDDDYWTNPSFYRLMRTLNIPYVMNTEADNLSKSLTRDTDDVFTESDAPAIFDGTESHTLADLAKYIFEHPSTGEVSLHGSSEYNLVNTNADSMNWANAYSTYTSGGGTKTLEEFKTALLLNVKDKDIAQGASYVENSRHQIEEAIGGYIDTVGIWGGTPQGEVDGITIGLPGGGQVYDFRGNDWAAAGTIVSSFYKDRSPWRLDRLSDGFMHTKRLTQVIRSYYCEFFDHQPFSHDFTELKNALNHWKALQSAGIVSLITRKQYYKLGEFVINPVTKIDVTFLPGFLDINDVDVDSNYKVEATFEDNTKQIVTGFAVDRKYLDTSAPGVYRCYVNYKGINGVVDIPVRVNSSLNPMLTSAVINDVKISSNSTSLAKAVGYKTYVFEIPTGVERVLMHSINIYASQNNHYWGFNSTGDISVGTALIDGGHYNYRYENQILDVSSADHKYLYWYQNDLSSTDKKVEVTLTPIVTDSMFVECYDNTTGETITDSTLTIGNTYLLGLLIGDLNAKEIVGLEIFTDNNKVTYTQAYDEGNQVGYTLTPVTAGTWTITINCGNQRLEKKFTIV